jgi:hypothetical protein
MNGGKLGSGKSKNEFHIPPTAIPTPTGYPGGGIHFPPLGVQTFTSRMFHMLIINAPSAFAIQG